jgi:hypothetical protein
MFKKLLAVIAGSALIAQPVLAEGMTSVMTETGWSWNSGTSVATGSSVQAMKMIMSMTSTVKRNRYYRIEGDVSGYSGSGTLRAFAGITMPATTPGTWKLLSDVPNVPDRFTLSTALSGYSADEDHTVAPGQMTGPGNSAEIGGSMRFFCSSAGHFYGDPLLYPGIFGAGHLHTRMGNDNTNPNSTYTSLRLTGGTSCQNRRIDANKPVYATALWFPSMLDGVGNVIDPDQGLIYYKGPAADQGATIPGYGTMDYAGVGGDYTKPSRFGGVVTANGTTTITRSSGALFTTLAPGSTVYIGTTAYTVSSVTNGNSMVISGSPTTGTYNLDIFSPSLKQNASRECAERAHPNAIANPLTIDGVSGVICPMVPKGSVFIFGYNKANGQGRPDVFPYSPNDANHGDNGTGAVTSGTKGNIDFSCWTGDQTQSQLSPNFDTLADLMAHGAANPSQCPIGGKVHIGLGAPWCWDGLHVDSPDHRAHWRYGTIPTAHVGNNACPSTHPYPVQQFSLQYYYTIDQAFRDQKWRLTIDEMVHGLPAGVGAHMDYEEATSPAARNLFFFNCHFTHNSCTDDLGNGYFIRKPRDYDDLTTTGHDGPCNSCAKPNPGRYTKTNEFGMSWTLPTSGHFSVVVKAPGDGVWGLMGLGNYNGTISNLTITPVSSGTRN